MAHARGLAEQRLRLRRLGRLPPEPRVGHRRSTRSLALHRVRDSRLAEHGGGGHHQPAHRAHAELSAVRLDKLPTSLFAANPSGGELPRLPDGHVPESGHHGHRRVEPRTCGQHHVGIPVGDDPEPHLRPTQPPCGQLHGGGRPRRPDEALDPRRAAPCGRRDVAELWSRLGHELWRHAHCVRVPGPHSGLDVGNVGECGERLIARRVERDALRHHVGAAHIAVYAIRLLHVLRLRVAKTERRTRRSSPAPARPSISTFRQACLPTSSRSRANRSSARASRLRAPALRPVPR